MTHDTDNWAAKFVCLASFLFYFLFSINLCSLAFKISKSISSRFLNLFFVFLIFWFIILFLNLLLSLHFLLWIRWYFSLGWCLSLCLNQIDCFIHCTIIFPVIDLLQLFFFGLFFLRNFLFRLKIVRFLLLITIHRLFFFYFLLCFLLFFVCSCSLLFLPFIFVFIRYFFLLTIISFAIFDAFLFL